MARRKSAPKKRKQTKLTTAAAPHVAAIQGTRGIMGDVLIALLPALAVATYFFGPRVLTLALVTAAAAIAFELLFRLALKKTVTITDGSALVTGVLLAMCLPVTAPYWAAVLGAGFAIVVVKQLYGGLGCNFLNPALAGWAFLRSFPAMMNFFVPPGGPSRWIDWFDPSGAVSMPVPMESLRQGIVPVELSLRQLLLGQRGGPMGEIAAFALLLGGGYLVLRRVLSPRIPLCFVGTVAALTYLFPRGEDALLWMLYQLLGGGLLLGAIFMASDYTTSPITPWGQVFYGVGCGGLTVLLRYFSPLLDGVGFAILTMNVCVPLLDLVGRPRRFGKPWKLPGLPEFQLPKLQLPKFKRAEQEQPDPPQEGGADDGA